MKKLSKFLRSFHLPKSTGFTLIELLVVIGILGVLAAALVATIDPFEQLKKANDANVKNTIVEFIDANIRYYTTHSHMPWAPGGCNAGNNPTDATLYPSLTDCLSSLIGDGELQAGFTSVTGILSAIYVNGTAQDVTACFQPQSKAERSDTTATKYNADGTLHSPATDCNPTSTSCYWCTE